MIPKNNSLEPSKSLNELIVSLTETEKSSFDRIIRSANIPKENFEGVATWSNKCYTRNCIDQNEKFELILICWEGGQSTPIHDHGGEECWVKIIEGEFKETIYKKGELGELNVLKSSTYVVGEVSYMVDFMGYHRLENLSKKRSMSLHLYAKPIRNCNVYNEGEKNFLQKEMSYDTICELTPDLQ